MNVTNHMELKIESRGENEAFARVVVGAFFAQLNPTLEEICDVKTAVSEAVTNAIIHGYNEKVDWIMIKGQIIDNSLHIQIEDKGCGISDVKQAMEPMYTTKGEMDRAGMGFVFMDAFMDTIEVESKALIGTTIRMTKKVNKESENEEPWIKQSL